MGNKLPSRADPIPYAEPTLAKGTTYRQLAYPSDRSNFWNPARIVDDGTTLRLEPGPTYARLIGICLCTACFIAIVLFLDGRRFVVPNVLKLLLPEIVLGSLFVFLVVIPGFRSLGRQRRIPWIEARKQERAIYLPRAKKIIPWSNVVRLQLVCFARVGWSTRTLSYHGEPYSGELQMVFQDGGAEQTWCLVSWPAKTHP
jgi:hypothetical protein